MYAGAEALVDSGCPDRHRQGRNAKLDAGPQGVIAGAPATEGREVTTKVLRELKLERATRFELATKSLGIREAVRRRLVMLGGSRAGRITNQQRPSPSIN